MFDWLFQLIDDIRRFPSELKNYNETNDAISKVNFYLFLLLIASSIGLVYFQYLIAALAVFILSFFVLFFNEAIFKMMCKLSAYAAGSVAAGAAIALILNLIFQFDFNTALMTSSVFGFLFCCVWFGVD